MRKKNKGSYVYEAMLRQGNKTFSIEDISRSLNNEHNHTIDSQYVDTYITRMVETGIVDEDIKGFVFSRN